MQPARLKSYKVRTGCNLRVSSPVWPFTVKHQKITMKRILITLVLCGAALAFNATAGDDKTPAKPSEEMKAFKKELLSKYDTNKDGKLDADEKAKISADDKAKMKELSGNKKGKNKEGKGEKKAKNEKPKQS